MKITRLSVVAALAVALLALCSKPASAQDAKEGKQGKRGPSVEQQMTRMTEALSLTDEQKPKVKAVLEDSQKKRQEIFADTSIPRDQMREKMRPIMEDQDKKLKEILTPDQYVKYEKMRDEMRRNRAGGQGGEKKKEN